MEGAGGGRARRVLGGLPLAAALLGVAAILLPRGVLSGKRQLYGGDFIQLHQYRMELVREAWAAGARGVPGWYSREALGMPFAADVQNFPWLPTRLPLLLFPP